VHLLCLTCNECEPSVCRGVSCLAGPVRLLKKPQKKKSFTGRAGSSLLILRACLVPGRQATRGTEFESICNSVTKSSCCSRHQLNRDWMNPKVIDALLWRGKMGGRRCHANSEKEPDG
jgi:hypothetical protein